jgi:small GTP-binding protein
VKSLIIAGEMDSQQIRVTLYKNAQNPGEGADVLVSRSISKADMLARCSSALGFAATKIYNKTGTLLNSFEGLADGAVLYVSRGEAFQVKKSTAGDQRAGSRRWMMTMLGAAAVGKSAITLRYVNNRFVKDYDPTIEDFYQKTAQVDGEAANLSILDTAGMEDYESLIDHWIDKKEAFVLVFSVQLPETMQRLREFHDKILHRYEMKDTRSPVVVIAANKIDVAERYVSSEQARQLAAELNVPLFEVSAQNNTNIEEMFAYIIRELRKKWTPAGKPQAKKHRCQLL